MTKKRDSKWLFEKKAMSKQFVAIMGWRIPIRDVPEGNKAIAYTSAEPAIYISKDNMLTDGLKDHKARAVRFGLFAHEMGHQQFTDFEHAESVASEMEPWEAQMFNIIFNVCEDPAVENMSSTFIGGYLLKALKYMTKRSYDVSENIEKFEAPIEQCLQAMCQFGTMGPLKGKFTQPKAKKHFYEIIPKMLEIFKEGDPKKRVDLSLEIFEDLRPIWEEYAKKMYAEKGLEAFAELMASALGKSMTSGSGSGEEVDPEELADAADFSKGAKRETTFKKIEEEEEKKKSEVEVLSEGEEGSEGEGGEGSEASGTREGEMISSDEETVYYSDGPEDLSREGDYDPEEYEIDRKGMDFFERLIQTEIEMAADSASTRETEVPDFPEIAKKYSSREYKCSNIFINDKDPIQSEYAYEKIIKKNARQLKACYNKLKRLFAEESDETEYKSSGKLSIERTMETKVTSKLFTKVVGPKDKSNMAVIIAIDESGSMYGPNIERAKEAAINLVEIFGRLGIPTYVMGYTADTRGADVVHYHYTDWNNRKEDRYKLTSIYADCNNFDGYSIRYASNVLNMRPEIHKVMIVISDGQPACQAYTRATGYSDTKDAIREARGKGQVVLGVAIGSDEEVLQKMYGNDFIFLRTGEDLFDGIMKKFTLMVKKW